ncbi:MAG: PAAR domain-containing protein [Bdellovibrionales bacterium]|nr:PAAR domain-containing protein [Bdellovibrionales bacterium]
MSVAANAFAAGPAARIGDTTSHGGTIVNGLPTVMISGLPAARIGDTVVCPQVSNNDNGAVPHIGGPIITGSPTVLIGGLPAASIGDTVAESGPPSTIVSGSPTVLIGTTGSQ